MVGGGWRVSQVHTPKTQRHCVVCADAEGAIARAINARYRFKGASRTRLSNKRALCHLDERDDQHDYKAIQNQRAEKGLGANWALADDSPRFCRPSFKSSKACASKSLNLWFVQHRDQRPNMRHHCSGLRGSSTMLVSIAVAPSFTVAYWAEL